jgi:hypothetical protein
MSRGVRVAVPLLAIAFAAGWPAPSTAQAARAIGDFAVIKDQLRLAAESGERALRGFGSIARDPSLPLDAETLQAAKRAYAMIGAAKLGLEDARRAQPVLDPVLHLAHKKLEEAWNLSRYPGDRASWAVWRQEYLHNSMRNLGRALRLVDQALVLLP